MKYVKSVHEEDTIVIAANLTTLLACNDFIGFVASEDGAKYLVVGGGTARGLAVSPTGTYASSDSQKCYPMERYRVFDTANELYEWLKD